MRLFISLFLLFAFLQSPAQYSAELRQKLDSFFSVSKFPAMSVSVASPKETITYSFGYGDTTSKKKLTDADMFLSGSVGKTYCAALILQLAEQKKLNLDDKLSAYLGELPWFNRIPNAKDITLRMLLNHTSGVMRYEFKEQFTKDLTANPDKVWKPEDLLAYIFDEKPMFEAGKDWEYSDTNYILLAMVIEKLTGKKYYAMINERLLTPMHLKNTRPSDKRLLKGLVQGYAGAGNDFGGKSEVIGADGKFIINPQFEWSGGGIYQTTADLANWTKMLQEGKLFGAEMLAEMKKGVPAKLGPGSQYGIGTIIRTPAVIGKTIYGHSGFFPGYLTESFYIPELQTAVAVHVNTSDIKNIKVNPFRVVVETMKYMLTESLSK